jgi:hypothetical protein
MRLALYRRMRSLITLAALSFIAAACADPTAPTIQPYYHPVVVNDAEAADAARPNDPGCSFDRGTNSCVTTSERTEVSTHQEFSGCLAGPPPFRPGRRVRTFEDTYLVTTTTTTQQHGLNGKIYDTQSSETRTKISSREIGSVCEAV